MNWNKISNKEEIHVAVIGAGVAGINAARALSQTPKVRFTVFDKTDSIGGVWREGYLGFGIQTPKHMYHFPDEPWPKDTPNFPSGKQIQDYMEEYANKHGLSKHFKCSTEVKSITRNKDDTWTLMFKNGPSPQVFHGVVVCTGLYGAPKKPLFANENLFKGNVYHSSQFLDPSMVKGKKVVTIGVGKSGIDLANHSMLNGAESSDIIFRKAHWFVPQKILGLVPFDWATFNRFGGALLHPYHKISTFSSVLHAIFSPIKWLIWRLVEIIFSLQQGLWGLGMKPDTRIELDAFGSGQLETNPSFFKAARQGKIGIHAGVHVREFKENSLVLDNGKEVSADVVFLATGYSPSDMSMLFPQESIESDTDGYYLYRHIVFPNIPNVFFVGALSDTFSNITNSAIQSRWVAEFIKGTHSLPDEGIMRSEIESVKAWKRSWMPESPSRAGHIQLHQVHYYDELIKDFGGEHKRMGNPISEFLKPYHPVAYKKIVDHAPLNALQETIIVYSDIVDGDSDCEVSV
eukprot:CAMPEP_0194131404 /NCGR_PEP_ID=MMETSP0152-20130528/2183_1 /TAXON_ID=1049557 /ORGANISM="Thalassiothrix antarctica, Strain L6-D1" /LENGTH=516 /DNA_ID=CAMNT_0038826177 /DNA_START=70 /DNA_END=1620 /DNA_ORIENTATION=-